jgi:low temperature requirement protein LtrA
VLLFVSAYFVVRLLHVVVYAYGLREEPDARRAVLAVAPTFILGPAALFTLPWVAEDWRLLVLLAALAVDASGPYLSGVAGFHVRAGHFAERFSLFVIITLGEALISVGLAADGEDLSAAWIFGAALAFALAVLIWWAYFDVAALAAEERLGRASLDERAVLARDAYTYLHYLLIAGIIVFAYGCKDMVAAATDEMTTAGAVALCGGIALYLLGQAIFRLRMTHSYGIHHLAAAGASLLLLAFAVRIPALVCGAILGVIMLAALFWERHELGAVRRRLHGRSGAQPEGAGIKVMQGLTARGGRRP